MEQLECRGLMAAPNLFIPSATLFPPQDLQQAPVITSQNGSLDATMNMVKAGFTSDPILYGGQPILSSPPDPTSPNNPDNPVYAMAYQVDAYGKTYPAAHPGPTLQLQVGDTLNLHVIDNLADPSTPRTSSSTRTCTPTGSTSRTSTTATTSTARSPLARA